jgi:anti-sigma regulatory factor (Ser/Thr protein kinase)
MSDQPNVHLALASRAENVVLVREVLGGLAEAINFGETLDDVKAAVSEACNNVVVHAYPGGEGPMEVDLRVSPYELVVTVRDFGVGTIHRREDDEAPGRGIGLAVIEALASGVELRSGPGEGAEVVMGFEIPDDGALAGGTAAADVAGSSSIEHSAVRVLISPSVLSEAILHHLVSALAARAGFSIDRLSDAQLLSDALAARIHSVLDGGCVALGMDAPGRSIVLRVGRLRRGGAAELLAGSAVVAVGPLIERLADEVETAAAGGGEVLVVLMRAAPDSPGA